MDAAGKPRHTLGRWGRCHIRVWRSLPRRLKIVVGPVACLLIAALLYITIVYALLPCLYTDADGLWWEANGCRYGLTIWWMARGNQAREMVLPTSGLTAQEDPCQNGKEKCVVAIGIYGDKRFYLDGALRNIIMGRVWWPGWTVRVYTDATLPPAFIEELKTPSSEVVVVPADAARGGISGMYWRLFVANDPTVDRFIVRDSDSSPGARERAALDEWIRSDLAFHVFRDSPSHWGWPIVGCCWGGARSQARPQTGKSILPYSAVQGPVRRGEVLHLMRAWGGDQDFLRDFIWPLIRPEHLLSHDSFHCLEFPSTRPWPTRRRGPRDQAARISVEMLGLDAAASRQWQASYVADPEGFETRLVEGPFAAHEPTDHCPVECRPPDHQDWLHC